MGFRAHLVVSGDAFPPVYWANDLFLRRAISVATDMAESGGTALPRIHRHGYSRAPLSAASRTVDSCHQARLPVFRDKTSPAPARAPLHAPHPSDGSRSDPDRATARHDCGGEGFCAAAWRLDRRASGTS